MSRLHWSKFGEAIKNTVCWSSTEDVDMEITHKELKHHATKLNDSGVYVALADKLKWQESDMQQIREAECAEDMFKLIFNRKAATREAELTAKFNPRVSAVEANYAEAMKKIKAEFASLIPEPPPQILKTSEATVQAAPQKALGIRGRFNAKIAERRQQEADNPPAAVAGGGMGLSARLRQMKTDRVETEQEFTLFVSNISQDTDEQDLRDILTDFNVRRVNYVRKNGNPVHSGVGFVVLAARDEAERCMGFLNGHKFHHLILCAAFSKPRDA